jgi:uridine kinase
MPTLLRALRAGEIVRAPGYDSATRGAAGAVTYDPAARPVIVLEGSFAGHHSIRDLLDFDIFVAAPEELQRERFSAFYRWKGFGEDAIAALWDQRVTDEWPAVDAQRDSSDFVLTRE